MSDDAIQQTLTGEEADARERPDTMLYCGDCDAFILRSHRQDHPHTLYESRGDFESGGGNNTTLSRGDDEEDDEDVIVGEVFDVDIKMEATVTARVVASCESDAIEKAGELRLGNKEDLNGNVPEPRLTMTLHETASSVKDVYESDEELAERLEGYPW